MRRNPTLLFILSLYVALASVYSVVNPLFESPDEVWHYEYVRWLVEGHGLAHPDDVGHAPWHQEGSQPPLYYMAAAALTFWIPTDNADAVIRYNPHAAIGQPDAFGNKNMMVHGVAESWSWRGVALAAHTARFFSIFLGALTVVATFGIARTLWRGRPAVALVASVLVAFNPQFLFLSAAINNDNLVTAVSALTVWLCVWFVSRRAEERGSEGVGVLELVLLGVLVGVGALSKLSGLALTGLAGLTLLILAWQRRSLVALVRWGLVVGVVALVVAGWWFVRNWLLFGDPLALTAMFDILPRRPAPPSLTELVARAQGVWRSLWAVFGWFNVVVDERLYQFYGGLSLLGLLGFLLGFPLQRFWHRRTHAPEESIAHSVYRIPHSQIALLLIWIAVIFLSLLSWAQMRYPQGRLLYPALSAAAVLLGVGLMNWLPRRWQRNGAWLLTAILFGLAALVPWLWIAPVYAPPAVVAADAAPQQVIDAAFGDQIRLIGYEISTDEVQPGETLDVTLYWQAIQPLDADYSVFIHLTDNYDILQAQRDSYPGMGNWPTSEWRPGAVVLDRHRVVIPETAPTPAQLRLDVGLYIYGTETRLPVATVVGTSDHVTLGYIGLLPPQGDGSLPHSLFINFDDQIALVGFEMDRRVMQPSETLTLTLWWEALALPKLDYKVFTHLVLPSPDVNGIDATWAQMDSDPRGGEAPTSSWQPGQRIEDTYTLTLPASAPSGVYFVEIGLYDPDTHDRLQVNFSDKGVVLGQVRVVIDSRS